MFIDPSDLVCIECKDNKIYVKRKMDIATETAVVADMRQIDAGSSSSLAAYNLALLKRNIKKWEGPDFDGIPCTISKIEQLDPNEPLIKILIDKINELNAPAESGTDPNPKTGGGNT